MHWSRLEEDLLPLVEALTCLRRLSIINACAGSELCFRRGFTMLQQLQWGGAQFLSWDSCKELKTLPHGLEYHTQLETLRLNSVPVKLIESIRDGERLTFEDCIQLMERASVKLERPIVFSFVFLCGDLVYGFFYVCILSTLQAF